MDLSIRLPMVAVLASLLLLAPAACQGPSLNFDFSFYDAGSVPSGPPPPPPCCCDLPFPDPTTGFIPERPSGPPGATSGSVVLAMSKLYFGDTDRNGTPNPDAWKKYGRNIDHKATGESATDTCTLAVGADCSVQLDGDNGVDNSFGANFVPMLDYFAPGIGQSTPTFTSNANAAIEQGGATMLVRLDGVGSAASYAPLPGALYRAVATISRPKWDGTDVRDVDDLSLVGANLSQPLAAFSGGYMNQRTWVGAPAAGVAYLDLQGTLAALPPIPIHDVQVVMNVAPDNTTAVEGMLSGIILTTDAVAWIQRLAGGISTSLCSGSAFESIAAQLGQTSDILQDGTNVAGKKCDAISVGLGFDAVAVQLGQPRVVPTPIDSCSD